MCQISIRKGGMKCIPYVIFKGEDSIFCMHYLYVILNYLMNHIHFSSLLFFQTDPDKPGKNAVTKNLVRMKLGINFLIIMGIYILLVNNAT